MDARQMTAWLFRTMVLMLIAAHGSGCASQSNVASGTKVATTQFPTSTPTPKPAPSPTAVPPTAALGPTATAVPNPPPQPQKATVPQYILLNEEIYDAPIKTQVISNILVSGEITDQGLRELLKQLYDSIGQRKGFKYHPSPTAIYVYAFTSKERAESGMGQWIAMLEKSHAATSPGITINNSQLALVGTRPEERFGLPEQRRVQIWSEYCLVENRAADEAERQHPIDPTQSMEVGQSLMLTKGTNLVPEIRPKDPISAMQQMKWLAPGTRITVVKVDTSEGNLWYWVRAANGAGVVISEGWINSIGLINQAPVSTKEQMSKQSQLRNSLIEKYKAELAVKYGISAEQLDAIRVEGLQKDWPFPRPR